MSDVPRSKPLVFYKATGIYCLISDWFEEMLKEGKLKETGDNIVTRADIGVLNGRISEVLKSRNPHLEIKTV